MNQDLQEGLRELNLSPELFSALSIATTKEQAETALKKLQRASSRSLRRVALECHPDKNLGEKEGIKQRLEKRMKLASLANSSIQGLKLKPKAQPLSIPLYSGTLTFSGSIPTSTTTTIYIRII